MLRLGWRRPAPPPSLRAALVDELVAVANGGASLVVGEVVVVENVAGGRALVDLVVLTEVLVE